MKPGSGQKIRDAARELLDSAAGLGIAEPWRLLECTPREIGLRLRAAEAARQAELERIDLLAWLAGCYVRTAYHAPKRYPRRPDGIRRRPAEMTDGQIKQVFAAMAARNPTRTGKEEGDGGS